MVLLAGGIGRQSAGAFLEAVSRHQPCGGPAGAAAAAGAATRCRYSDITGLGRGVAAGGTRDSQAHRVSSRRAVAVRRALGRAGRSVTEVPRVAADGARRGIGEGHRQRRNSRGRIRGEVCGRCRRCCRCRYRNQARFGFGDIAVRPGQGQADRVRARIVVGRYGGRHRIGRRGAGAVRRAVAVVIPRPAREGTRRGRREGHTQGRGSARLARREIRRRSRGYGRRRRGGRGAIFVDADIRAAALGSRSVPEILHGHRAGHAFVDCRATRIELQVRGIGGIGAGEVGIDAVTRTRMALPVLAQGTGIWGVNEVIRSRGAGFVPGLRLVVTRGISDVVAQHRIGANAADIDGLVFAPGHPGIGAQEDVIQYVGVVGGRLLAFPEDFDPVAVFGVGGIENIVPDRGIRCGKAQQAGGAIGRAVQQFIALEYDIVDFLGSRQSVLRTDNDDIDTALHRVSGDNRILRGKRGQDSIRVELQGMPAHRGIDIRRESQNIFTDHRFVHVPRTQNVRLVGVFHSVANDTNPVAAKVTLIHPIVVEVVIHDEEGIVGQAPGVARRRVGKPGNLVAKQKDIIQPAFY